MEKGRGCQGQCCCLGCDGCCTPKGCKGCISCGSVCCGQCCICEAHQAPSCDCKGCQGCCRESGCYGTPGQPGACVGCPGACKTAEAVGYSAIGTLAVLAFMSVLGSGLAAMHAGKSASELDYFYYSFDDSPSVVRGNDVCDGTMSYVRYYNANDCFGGACTGSVRTGYVCSRVHWSFMSFISVSSTGSARWNSYDAEQASTFALVVACNAFAICALVLVIKWTMCCASSCRAVQAFVPADGGTELMTTAMPSPLKSPSSGPDGAVADWGPRGVAGSPAADVQARPGSPAGLGPGEQSLVL